MTSTKKEEFSVKDIPSLAGYIAIVTGGTFSPTKLGQVLSNVVSRIQVVMVLAV